MTVFETDRLTVRRAELADAPLFLELVNEPAYVRFIRDEGVRTLADTDAYVRTRGHKSFVLVRKADGAPLGTCGIYRRDWLEHADLGYALLARHHGQGYAREAAQGLLRNAREALGLARLQAIVEPTNDASVKLLTTLGFRAAGAVIEPKSPESLALYDLLL